MKGFITCCVLLLSLGSAACGSDDNNGGSAEPEASSSAPEPAASLDDAVAELNQSIADQDCELIMELTFSALRSNEAGDGPAEPGDPIREEECAKNAPAVPLLADLEGTTFEESEEWGAAAITDGSGGKTVGGYDSWTAIWLVDRDGQWRHASFFPADPQIEGEDLPESTDPVAVTEQLVDAMESEDCSDAEEFVSKASRFASDAKEGCEALAGGSIFAPAVRSAEEVTVEELGRARDYAITGVDTGDTYFAVQLATPPIAPNKPQQTDVQVVDVLPLTDFEYVEPQKK